jgi:hypothetical protein
MGFATATVEALLEESDLGFQVVDTLLHSLDTVGLVGSALVELGLEFGLAGSGALVKCLVVARLLAKVAEGLLAVRPGAGQWRGQGLGEGCVHAQA